MRAHTHFMDEKLSKVTMACGIRHNNIKYKYVFHVQYSTVTPDALYTADRL
jgi:hypothetical protein